MMFVITCECKPEMGSLLFSCGHKEGSSSFCKVLDHECYKCDPDDYSVRVIYELRIRGVDLSDDRIREMLAEFKERETPHDKS